MTHEHLLEAAALLFARRGFNATSVEQIAEEAGCTIGALYSHFGSKAAVFFALYDRHHEQEMEALDASLATAADGAGRLRPYYERALGDRDWSLLYFEFWLHAARDPKLLKGMKVRSRHAMVRIAQLIERHGPAEADAERVAGPVLALNDGIALHRLVDSDAFSADLSTYATGALINAFKKPTDTRR